MNRMLRALKQLEAKSAADVNEKPAGAIDAAGIVEAPQAPSPADVNDEAPQPPGPADVADESPQVLDAADVAHDAQQAIVTAEAAIESLHEADSTEVGDDRSSVMDSAAWPDVAELVDDSSPAIDAAAEPADAPPAWDDVAADSNVPSAVVDEAGGDTVAEHGPTDHSYDDIERAEFNEVTPGDPEAIRVPEYLDQQHQDHIASADEPGNEDQYQDRVAIPGEITDADQDPIQGEFQHEVEEVDPYAVPPSHGDNSDASLWDSSPTAESPWDDHVSAGLPELVDAVSSEYAVIETDEGEPTTEVPRDSLVDSTDHATPDSTSELLPDTSPDSSDTSPEPSLDALPEPSLETSHDSWTGTRSLGAANSPPHLVRRPAAIESSLLEGEPETPLGRAYLALADRISRQWWMQASAALLLVAPDMEPEVCRTAAHLAARLARHGTRDVLLMDCNVTDKALSDLFELRGKAGLTDVLHGRADAAECVTATSIDGLHVLPAGRGDARQFDDVARSIGQLLAQLKQRYRYVIASGDAQEAAGRVIARLCDGTYVLVRLGQTEMEPAALAMQHLLEAGARVLGCVVVNAPEGLGVE